LLEINRLVIYKVALEKGAAHYLLSATAPLIVTQYFKQRICFSDGNVNRKNEIINIIITLLKEYIGVAKYNI